MTSHFQTPKSLPYALCFANAFMLSWMIHDFFFLEFHKAILHNWTWFDIKIIFRQSFSHFSSQNIKIFLFTEFSKRINTKNTSERFELRLETEHKKKISNKKFEVSAARENWKKLRDFLSLSPDDVMSWVARANISDNWYFWSFDEIWY